MVRVSVCFWEKRGDWGRLLLLFSFTFRCVGKEGKGRKRKEKKKAERFLISNFQFPISFDFLFPILNSPSSGRQPIPSHPIHSFIQASIHPPPSVICFHLYLYLYLYLYFSVSVSIFCFLRGGGFNSVAAAAGLVGSSERPWLFSLLLAT